MKIDKFIDGIENDNLSLDSFIQECDNQIKKKTFSISLHTIKDMLICITLIEVVLILWKWI
jgi:hypothetical protein